jgi:hypothetical protein
MIDEVAYFGNARRPDKNITQTVSIQTNARYNPPEFLDA